MWMHKLITAASTKIKSEWYIINREYFDVKIFSDSMACAKIKRTKYMHSINNNVVQGRCLKII